MTTATVTTSRERLANALNHKQPDRIPIDFGGTAVTGVHASCVAALREYYGLEKRPVRVHEPFQMLALLDDDLKDAMGVDVTGIFARNTMFGFPVERWKTWNFNGLEVLVPGDFNITVDERGDTLIYPEGDMTVPPSGRMPKGGYFFDCIIRQEPLDEEQLNPEDNMEEFGPIAAGGSRSPGARRTRKQAARRGVIAGFGGTAFGDIALVPGPFLKHPKGIRDVAEWYVSTRSRQDYIHKIFERQCEIALGNLERIYAAVGDKVQAVFVCGTDFGTQTSAFCSVKTLRDLYFPYYKRVNDWIHAHTPWKTFKHSCGAVSKFIPIVHRGGLRHSQSRAVFGDGHGARATEGEVRRPDRLLGRRRGHAKDAALRNAGRGARAGAAPLRDLRARRRIRLQHHSQRAGADAGREHRRHARRGARVQREKVRAADALTSRTPAGAPLEWLHLGLCAIFFKVRVEIFLPHKPLANSLAARFSSIAWTRSSTGRAFGS